MMNAPTFLNCPSITIYPLGNVITICVRGKSCSVVEQSCSITRSSYAFTDMNVTLKLFLVLFLYNKSQCVLSDFRVCKTAVSEEVTEDRGFNQLTPRTLDFYGHQPAALTPLTGSWVAAVNSSFASVHCDGYFIR